MQQNRKVTPDYMEQRRYPKEKGEIRMVQALLRLCKPKDLQETEEERAWAELVEELQDTRYKLRRTYLQFNSTDDPDLIEAALFEIKAHQARHSYLLRKIKQLDALQRAHALKAE